MAHYALIDKNNIVVRVIVGKDEDDTHALPDGFNSWEEYYESTSGFVCKRTSYNTYCNTHSFGKTPYRGNYAGIGYIYDLLNDIFYPPKPFNSWFLDITTASWKPPIEIPDNINNYEWSELDLSWILVQEDI